MKKNKKYFGNRKKFNDHIRMITFESTKLSSQLTFSTNVITSDNVNELYNTEMYKKNDILTQTFSEKFTNQEVIRENLVGKEDLLKINGYFQIANSVSNNFQLVDNIVTVQLLVEYKYKIIANPVILKLTKSFKYDYLNKKYSNFSKRSQIEREKLLKELDSDRDYNNEKQKYFDPFISFLVDRIYDTDDNKMEEEQEIKLCKRYDIQKLVCLNDHPSRIKFKIYCDKPVAPIYVNYVLDGWKIFLIIDQKQFCNYTLHLNAIVMDNYQSYVVREKNLTRYFNKFKELFEKIKKEKSVMTFSAQINQIIHLSNERVKEGKSIEKGQVGYIHRKIKGEKLYLLNEINSSSSVIFNKEIINKNNIETLLDKTLKISKIFISFFFKCSENIPITVHVILNSFNPIENKISSFTLLSQYIYPNNFEENNHSNIAIIRSTGFYFKTNTDSIFIHISLPPNNINNNNNLIIEKCFIKYYPIINLNDKVSNDQSYYPILIIK